MKVFLFLLAVILSVIHLPVTVAKVRGQRPTKTDRQLKKSGRKEKSSYYAPLMPQGEDKVFTVTTPLYKSYDTETGKLDDVVGTYYLVVVVYNYDDKGSDGYVPINDAKITLTFDTGSFIISDGLYGTDPVFMDYAITGGVGEYSGADGVMAIEVADGVVTFSF
jgi:hypothetical protein